MEEWNRLFKSINKKRAILLWFFVAGLQVTKIMLDKYDRSPSGHWVLSSRKYTYKVFWFQWLTSAYFSIFIAFKISVSYHFLEMLWHRWLLQLLCSWPVSHCLLLGFSQNITVLLWLHGTQQGPRPSWWEAPRAQLVGSSQGPADLIGGGLFWHSEDPVHVHTLWQLTQVRQLRKEGYDLHRLGLAMDQGRHCHSLSIPSVTLQFQGMGPTSLSVKPDWPCGFHWKKTLSQLQGSTAGDLAHGWFLSELQARAVWKGADSQRLGPERWQHRCLSWECPRPARARMT